MKIERPFPWLRILSTGGDRLSSSPQRSYRLFNTYGPTETTVTSSAYIVEEHSRRIPIGKPVGNTVLYILDPDGQLQPVGIPGHLHISGEGVARGYLNRPQLTAERFVNREDSLDGPVYNTGDLVRWLADGNIEFLGRIDQQVKIRGFRVEPGEVAHCLEMMPNVKQAVVTVRTDAMGDKLLCAYFTPQRGKGDRHGKRDSPDRYGDRPGNAENHPRTFTGQTASLYDPRLFHAA